MSEAVEPVSWRARARRLIHKTGYDLVKRQLPEDIRLLCEHRINLIFDVGASIGHYVRHVRTHGYRGHIISFEPLAASFSILEAKARSDPLWKVENYALGHFDGESEINVAGNSESSSLLPMLPSHVSALPTAAYIGKERIAVRKIDSIISEHYRPGQNLFLKIDAQGYEKQILEGARGSLDRIVGIQVEMSLLPLYAGETLIGEMIPFLSELGYNLRATQPAFVDPVTKQLWQLDGIFFKKPRGQVPR
jgi:FkbM family methyltransferase